VCEHYSYSSFRIARKSFDGISFDGGGGGEVGANKSGKAAMTMVDVLPEGVAPFARCVYGHFG
jgi:hypothetical protein